MTLDRFWHGTLRRPYHLYSHDHGGSGPVLILLHGIAASSDDWHEVVAALKSHYHIITIDLLGFGRSPKPQWASYVPQQHIRHIEATLRRVYPRGDFLLAGHSLGSLLATRLARRHPRRIRRLLLLSPPVYPPLDTITSAAARRRTALYFRLYKFLRLHPRVSVKNFERLKRILPLPRSVVRQPLTWLPFERTLEHCIEQQTIMADITAVRAPVDIFYGTLDGVVVPYNIEALEHLNGVSVHRIPRQNHDLTRRYALHIAKLLTD
jgi:pimeloyl-ACP methyl ester carboxylesterase